jgi:GrpB-like predicted nucleotidyltransferase (UPF0157 family)
MPVDDPRQPVEVVDYDPGWPALASEAAAEIAAATDGALTHIEHIGSTSVPGLAAKPVIDLMAATDRLADVTAVEPALTGRGFRLIDTGMPERLFYRRDGHPVAYHLHVVTADSWPTRNERILRDHLLAHPADAARYGDLKRQLVATGQQGEGYTLAKTALIQELVDRARADRGLPPVPVWEE